MIWSRWSGAGNTFYILSEPKKFRIERDELAKALCQRFPHAPTDGVLFLESSRLADADWDFYNSDGSAAEMCGNAARCATGFLFKKNPEKKNFSFMTKAGLIRSQVLSETLFEVEMPKLQIFERSPVFFVNSGVPHVVVESKFDLAIAHKFRSYPRPPGSNVTFITEIGDKRAKAVSFERGVEGLTQACGTGAVAAAAFLTARDGSLKFEIEMPGGKLEVENAVHGEHPKMRGPALWNYDFDDGGAWEGDQI